MSKRDTDRTHEETPGEPLAEDVQPEATPGAQEDAADSIEQLRAERDDFLARLQRVSADYLNYQKRVHRDVEQARAYANEKLIRELLDVLDNMERALQAAAGREDDPFAKGMQLVHDSMLHVLSRAGLSRIATEGEPFDPDRHAALMREPTKEHPPMTIVKEVVAGYELKGRPIRPAQVVVATAPEDEQD